MHVKQSRQGCCAACMRCWSLLHCLAELGVFCTVANHTCLATGLETTGAFEAAEGMKFNRVALHGTLPPTEGTLVEQQVRLQRAQQTERKYLAAAFTRVGELERRRAAGQAHVLTAFVRIYREAVVPIQQIAGEKRCEELELGCCSRC